MTTQTLSRYTQTDRDRTLLAQHFLTVLRDQNWIALNSIFTNDAVLKMPGNNNLSGIAVGTSAVIENIQAFTALNPLFYLNNIQLSYNGFALSLQIGVQAGNKTLSQQGVIACTLAGDKISAINFYLSDLHNLDAFFAGKLQHPEAGESNHYQTIVANTFLAAMKAEDWEMMGSAMEPDIDWTLPGESLLSGAALGVDAVVNRASSLKQFGVMFQLLNVLYGWDDVALSLHNTASRQSLILDEFVTIAFQLKGSRIQRMTTHLSDVPGIEAFFIAGIID